MSQICHEVSRGRKLGCQDTHRRYTFHVLFPTIDKENAAHHSTTKSSHHKPQTHTVTHTNINTVVSRVSAHEHLSITRGFGPHGLYRSCYIDPFKCSTWALTREWALAWDTMVYTSCTCTCRCIRTQSTTYSSYMI